MKVVINTKNVGLNLNHEAKEWIHRRLGYEGQFYYYNISTGKGHNLSISFTRVNRGTPYSRIFRKDMGDEFEERIDKDLNHIWSLELVDPSLHMERHDPLLVEMVEALGKRTSDPYFENLLVIKEIPDGSHFRIEGNQSEYILYSETELKIL